MKKRKLIVLAKPLKQLIFGGKNAGLSITFKFTKQLLTEVLHRHFSSVLF